MNTSKNEQLPNPPAVCAWMEKTDASLSDLLGMLEEHEHTVTRGLGCLSDYLAGAQSSPMVDGTAVKKAESDAYPPGWPEQAARIDALLRALHGRMSTLSQGAAERINNLRHLALGH